MADQKTAAICWIKDLICRVMTHDVQPSFQQEVLSCCRLPVDEGDAIIARLVNSRVISVEDGVRLRASVVIVKTQLAIEASTRLPVATYHRVRLSIGVDRTVVVPPTDTFVDAYRRPRSDGPPKRRRCVDEAEAVMPAPDQPLLTILRTELLAAGVRHYRLLPMRVVDGVVVGAPPGQGTSLRTAHQTRLRVDDKAIGLVALAVELFATRMLKATALACNHRQSSRDGARRLMIHDIRSMCELSIQDDVDVDWETGQVRINGRAEAEFAPDTFARYPAVTVCTMRDMFRTVGAIMDPEKAAREAAKLAEDREQEAIQDYMFKGVSRRKKKPPASTAPQTRRRAEMPSWARLTRDDVVFALEADRTLQAPGLMASIYNDAVDSVYVAMMLR